MIIKLVRCFVFAVMMVVSCNRETRDPMLVNMTSVLSSSWIISPVQDGSFRSRLNRIHYVGSVDASAFSARERCYGGSVHYVGKLGARKSAGSLGLCRALAGGDTSSSDEDDEPQNQDGEGMGDSFRDDLERMVGADDSNFTGLDLAALIKNKYGRSYDVQLIKKEFMGRSFLAMNVMWKYREQRSFPLTEEEYILRLDDVANNLRCWGAISHIRNSLAKLKERPRIGKAVSIFIDMDETGGRSREWIYK